MPRDQMLMGLAVAVACLIGLRYDRWLLRRTKKGARLVRWFGETRALWVLRGLLLLGALFGALLATDVIRPVRW